jgi:hypothetical protein
MKEAKAHGLELAREWVDAGEKNRVQQFLVVQVIKYADVRRAFCLPLTERYESWALRNLVIRFRRPVAQTYVALVDKRRRQNCQPS